MAKRFLLLSFSALDRSASTTSAPPSFYPAIQQTRALVCVCVCVWERRSSRSACCLQGGVVHRVNSTVAPTESKSSPAQLPSLLSKRTLLLLIWLVPSSLLSWLGRKHCARERTRGGKCPCLRVQSRTGWRICCGSETLTKAHFFASSKTVCILEARAIGRCNSKPTTNSGNRPQSVCYQHTQRGLQPRNTVPARSRSLLLHTRCATSIQPTPQVNKPANKQVNNKSNSLLDEQARASKQVDRQSDTRG